MNNELDVAAVHCALDWVMTIFGKDVATLDEKTLKENIKLLCDGGMPIEYRTMQKEVFDLILDNFAFIFALLVMDSSYRSMVLNYFILTAMRFEGSVPEKDVSECVVFDLTKYNADFVNECNKRLLNSFEPLSEFAYELDECVQKLDDIEKSVIGCIVSNFAYFIKAHCINSILVDITKNCVLSFPVRMHVKKIEDYYRNV